MTPIGASGKPTTVFLSYSRDDRPRVLPIIQALEAAGFSVWWDGLLQPGERFADITAAALYQAKAVVVMWTPTSVNSHWVHDEATRGRDRRCLVPLSVDGATPPLGFGQFQTIDVSHARPGDPSMVQVVAAVAALHDSDGHAAPQPAVKMPAAAPNRRLVLVGAGAASLLLAGVGAWQGGLLGGSRRKNAVAVLPFANLSGDASRDYLADGIAAEIRAELARNDRLVVVAQASSDKFRDRHDDARSITRQLGVAYLLDGNVQAVGSRMRVAAELINGETGFTVWSSQFDRPAGDIFSVQDEIAAAVTAALVSRLFGGSSARGREQGGTDNVQAYDAYLKGKHLFDEASGEDSDRAALAAFVAALTLDPDYGLAQAARARSLTVIANLYLQGSERRDTFAAAIAAGKAATTIAPLCAEAHSALGFAIFNGALNARSARPAYDRAAELGAGDADVLARFAIYSARCGRIAVARPAAAQAAKLDPLNARTAWLAGEVEYIARNPAEAVRLIGRGLALNPGQSVVHWALGAAKLALGDVPGAAEAFARERNSLFRLTGQAIVAQRQGRMEEAKAALARLVADNGDTGLYQQAQVYSAWGQQEPALACLLRARATGDAGVMYARGDPLLDPLRGDDRFKTLLADLGFD
ncbi:MAG: TIR domain-containing protein [Sphingomonadales bacterium]